MKYLRRIFESEKKMYSDYYINTLRNLKNKYDDDVKALYADYKENIDECLYYLTDIFDCEILTPSDDRNYYGTEVFGIEYRFKIKKSDVSAFFTESESVISRFHELGFYYNIHIRFEKDEQNINYRIPNDIIYTFRQTLNGGLKHLNFLKDLAIKTEYDFMYIIISS